MGVGDHHLVLQRVEEDRARSSHGVVKRQAVPDQVKPENKISPTYQYSVTQIGIILL
jgi:hypothetical protein